MDGGTWEGYDGAGYELLGSVFFRVRNKPCIYKTLSIAGLVVLLPRAASLT